MSKTGNFDHSEYDVIEEEAEDENTPLLQTGSEDFDSTSTVDSSHSNLSWKRRFGPFILGQIASILICLSGVTSILLANIGMSFPSIQNMASYFLISIVFTTKLVIDQRKINNNHLDGDPVAPETVGSMITSRGWKYLLITLADVGGNYLVVRAYQFTSLTSVQLLDCFSIPTVLVFSYIFLKARYKYFHFLGIFLCLLGVGCLVWADINSGRTSEGNRPLLGDIMCLSGAFLYGLSNVSQEFFVKSFNPHEFLGFIGFYGCFIAGIQTILFEESSVESWNIDSILLLISFAVIQFLFYTIVAHLLAMSNSVAMNLSILSADFYSILVGVFVFQYNFNVLYFLSFVFVIGGVAIFTIKSTPSIVDVVPEDPAAIEDQDDDDINPAVTTEFEDDIGLGIGIQNQEIPGASSSRNE